MRCFKLVLLLPLVLLTTNCRNKTNDLLSQTVASNSNLDDTVKVIPINHATLILEYDAHVIYIDPVGGVNAFKGQKEPTLILITDIHGDHFSLKTLEAFELNAVPVIGPQAVADKIPSTILPSITVMNNGETYQINGISIEALPMYNLREEALQYHEKGRGNGYVITLNDQRIYISGDTEDIPEMRNLKHIDKALICMNLPYTMPVENAANAVLDFQPKQVYPYHYRGSQSFSDIEKFKTLVETGNSQIDVVLLNWY
jgi:L-ascorbate metabolism protein UlaG (beta-lactamase superfamily)